MHSKFTLLYTKQTIADDLLGVFRRNSIIVVDQRAIASARISSRAFSSLVMKEHENGFVPLKRRNINLCKALEKVRMITLRENL